MGLVVKTELWHHISQPCSGAYQKFLSVRADIVLADKVGVENDEHESTESIGKLQCCEIAANYTQLWMHKRYDNAITHDNIRFRLDN